MRAGAACFSYYVGTDSSPAPFKMKKPTIAPVLCLFYALSLPAQQAPQQAAGQQQATPEDPKMKERIRVEGAAGGTAPLPDEKRGAVGAGAGPHRHDHLPSPAKLPRDEPVAPPK